MYYCLKCHPQPVAQSGLVPWSSGPLLNQGSRMRYKKKLRKNRWEVFVPLYWYTNSGVVHGRSAAKTSPHCTLHDNITYANSFWGSCFSFYCNLCIFYFHFETGKVCHYYPFIKSIIKTFFFYHIFYNIIALITNILSLDFLFCQLPYCYMLGGHQYWGTHHCRTPQFYPSN